MFDTIEVYINDSFGETSMKFTIYDYSDKIEINFRFLENIINADIYNDKLHEIFERIYKNNDKNNEVGTNMIIDDFNELSKNHHQYKNYNIELNKITNNNYDLLLNNI